MQVEISAIGHLALLPEDFLSLLNPPIHTRNFFLTSWLKEKIIVNFVLGIPAKMLTGMLVAAAFCPFSLAKRTNEVKKDIERKWRSKEEIWAINKNKNKAATTTQTWYSSLNSGSVANCCLCLYKQFHSFILRSCELFKFSASAWLDNIFTSLRRIN